MRLRRILAAVVVGAVVTAAAGHADGARPNDPLFDTQWNLRQVHAPEAWRHSTGAGVVIASIDGGVDLRHPDLAGQLVPGYSCAGGQPQDTYGQGTFLAGVAAARTNNGVGVAGVAPDARIMPIGDLYSRDCPRSEWSRSITWAADRGADVISLTWLAGTDGHLWQTTQRYYDEVKRAVEYAWKRGAVVVAPAGNGRSPLCAQPWAGTPVLCVGSTNRHGTLASFSNFDGAMQAHYLVAPAGEYVGAVGTWHVPCDEGVVSTWLRGARGENLTECGMPDGYTVTATNRIAVAHVAGVAALLSAQGRSNREVVRCLLEHADDLGAPGRDPAYGYGLVNALRAVRDC